MDVDTVTLSPKIISLNKPRNMVCTGKTHSNGPRGTFGSTLSHEKYANWVSLNWISFPGIIKCAEVSPVYKNIDNRKALKPLWIPSNNIEDAFVDSSKAFDCLPYGYLISKLYAYGLSTAPCPWCLVILRERRQHMKSSYCRSSWKPWHWTPCKTPLCYHGDVIKWKQFPLY